MKTSLSKALLLIVALFTFSLSNGQTTNYQALNSTYWNLRTKFQKRFVVIGTGSGRSLPVASLDPVDHYGTTCSQNSYTGVARFGDEPQLQGYYLATLATEYALLIQEGRPTNAVLNELYYAIEAINRLDRDAEPYLSQGSSAPSLNGLICRDDAPGDYMNYFTTTQYPITFDLKDLRYPCVESDGYDIEWECCYQQTGDVPGPFNKGNYMSQDHVFNLIMGMAFVKRYCDNVFVKPTAGDQGFYIVDEAKAIVTRLMSQITAEKYFMEEIECLVLDDADAFHIANWCLVNPVTGRREDPISEIHPFAYALALAANYVNGIDYTVITPQSGTLTFLYLNEAVSGLICRPDYLNVPIMSLAPFWNSLGAIPSYSYNTVYPVNTAPIWPSLVTSQTIPVQFTEFSTTQEPNLVMNAYLCMLIATTGASWPQTSVVRMSDDFNKSQIFDLVYSSLHNTSPIRSSSYYENLLNSMPCSGPFNYDGFNLSSTDESWPWNSTNIWTNGLNAPTVNQGSLGEYHALDWMLLYNLYRLHFNVDPTNYHNDACPCDGGNALIDLYTDPNLNFSGNIIISRRSPDYLDFDLALKEYLTHDLQLLSSSTIVNKTDLVLCNNSTLELESGSVLEIFSSSSDKGTVTLKAGSSLVLKSGSSLVLNDLSVLTAEFGSDIVVEAGANIILNDSGSSIDIKGRLLLSDNCNFNIQHNTVQGGYLRFSRDRWVPYDPNDPEYQIVSGLNCSIELTGTGPTDKVLEIDQNALWIPDALSSFKVSFGEVQFAGTGNNFPLLSIASPVVSLSSSRFITGNNSNYGAGVLLYGQPQHTIYDCEFSLLSSGLIAHNFYNISGLNVAACKFTQCGTGLVVWDKYVDLFACRFEQCGTGAALHGLTFNSSIKNCRFNNNTDLGLEVTGAPIEIRSSKTLFKNNGIAGISASGVTLNLACCDLRNNGQYGIVLDFDASLRMSPQFTGGNNDLSNNPLPIALNEANQIEISGGRNDLKPQGPSCNGNSSVQSCPAVFSGTIQTSCSPTVIIAKNNKWKQNYSNFTYTWNNQVVSDLPLSVNPVTAVGCGNSPVRISDPAQMSYNSCLNNSSSLPGWGGPQNNLTPLSQCSNCSSISTSSFSNVTSDSAARVAIGMMDSSVVNGYSSAVTLGHEILTFELTNESSGDSYVKNVTRRKMHEALADGLQSGQITQTQTSIATETQKVIDIEVTEKNKADSVGDYHRKFFAAMREAAAYRTAGKRDVALLKFNDILTWVSTSERPWTEYWVCLVEKELSVLNGSIPKEEFMSGVLNCINVTSVVPSLPRTMSDEEDANEIKTLLSTSIEVFPNPATTQINFRSHGEAIKAITIYSMIGESVYEQNGLLGKEYAVPLQNLNSGIYLFQITLDSGENEFGRFVVE